MVSLEASSRTKEVAIRYNRQRLSTKRIHGLSGLIVLTSTAERSSLRWALKRCDESSSTALGRQGARKRIGGALRITLCDAIAVDERNGFDALVVPEALDRLADLNQRHARLIELRFFGGLPLNDIAAVLGVTPRTLKRDWRVARNWLYSELTKE